MTRTCTLLPRLLHGGLSAKTWHPAPHRWVAAALEKPVRVWWAWWCESTLEQCATVGTPGVLVGSLSAGRPGCYPLDSRSFCASLRSRSALAAFGWACVHLLCAQPISSLLRRPRRRLLGCGSYIGYVAFPSGSEGFSLLPTGAPSLACLPSFRLRGRRSSIGLSLSGWAHVSRCAYVSVSHSVSGVGV